MKSIAIFGNKSQTEGFERLSALLDALSCHPAKLKIAVQSRYMSFLTRTIGLPPCSFPTFDTYSGGADLALSIGGDGSFLTTAASVGAYQTPIMGINSGHLGYLSAAGLDDADEIVEAIVGDKFHITPRSVIEVTNSSGVEMVRSCALNEVAVLKLDTASMITVDTRINGNPLAKYRGDGLIVSTPTGSTGYNLSVGGPIVAPMSSDWILSPIAAHSLNMRPLVVPDSSEIEIAASSRSDSFLLSVDGKATPLPIDARLTLRKASYVVNVVMRCGYNFTDTLRDKLYWGVDGL